MHLRLSFQIVRELFGLNDDTRFHSMARIRGLLLGHYSGQAVQEAREDEASDDGDDSM